MKKYEILGEKRLNERSEMDITVVAIADGRHSEQNALAV